MDDDLNIAGALGILFDVIRDTNKRIATLSAAEARSILDTWKRLDEILGLGMPTKFAVPADVQRLVDERQAARQAKNFKRSDEIRDDLATQGWIIEDTPQGPRAKRVG